MPKTNVRSTEVGSDTMVKMFGGMRQRILNASGEMCGWCGKSQWIDVSKSTNTECNTTLWHN